MRVHCTGCPEFLHPISVSRVFISPQSVPSSYTQFLGVTSFYTSSKCPELADPISRCPELLHLLKVSRVFTPPQSVPSYLARFLGVPSFCISSKRPELFDPISRCPEFLHLLKASRVIWPDFSVSPLFTPREYKNPGHLVCKVTLNFCPAQSMSSN